MRKAVLAVNPDGTARGLVGWTAGGVELDLDHLHAAIMPARKADTMGERLGLAVRALDQRFEFERVMRTPPCSSAPGNSSFW